MSARILQSSATRRVRARCTRSTCSRPAARSRSTRWTVCPSVVRRRGISGAGASREPEAARCARVISWLLLGFTMGLRHALEADHLAAVASLSARAASPAALLRVAGAWGVGHGLAILAIACLWVVTGVAVPDPAQPFVEAAAGLLLVWLGVDLLLTREGARAHLGVHEHRGGTVHAHLHWRASGERAADGVVLSHPHACDPLRRALFVGSLHGLGGAALLGLLAARGVHASQAIAYAAVFRLR